MFAGRVDIHAHQVDAELHRLIKALLQGGLIHVMLILSDTDALRVNLHQLRQRIHQSATDADRSTHRDIIFRELLPGNLGGGIDRGTILAHHEHLHFAIEADGGDELLGLSAGCAVADGNRLDVVGRYELRHLGRCPTLLVLRSVREDCLIMQQCALCI